MAEVALGWLGWSEDQALSADVNSIRVGMAGRTAMLKAVFGGSDEGGEKAPAPITPGMFKALFKGGG